MIYKAINKNKSYFFSQIHAAKNSIEKYAIAFTKNTMLIFGFVA